MVGLSACQPGGDQPKAALFTSLNKEVSNITFANNILENDTLNYFTFPYLYMGGGIAAGDINQDGLTDLFFTGNMVANQLYLNQGSGKFTDITKAAGLLGDNRWYTGATMADINDDGWLDIYVCVSGKYTTTENQLYINNQDNTFTERAAEYGLNDASPSIQATFFDYDQDGYQDLYVATYPNIPVSLGNQAYQSLAIRNDWADSGHLYRNRGDGSFQDVTEAAGIKDFSLALGVVATDLNNDGRTDLYVSNDFNIPDYLYLNQGNGRFEERIKESTNHTAMFGMGVDAADFNNDGWIDLLQVDMTPEDYRRAKTNMASMSPDSFNEAVRMGFHYQYMQNSLHLNNGTSQQGIPMFSEISRFAGMATTDWSWGALWADLDNDGWKDAFITNGMKRDVNNNDANQQLSNIKIGAVSNPDLPSIDILPSEPISNYAFRNRGDFTFEPVAETWGLNEAGFSNGVVYADLDNDGDLDVVINNLDGVASVFINQTNSDQNHYLTIRLEGPANNRLGLGSRVSVTTPGGQQLQELTLTRGFQSSVAPILHFGLGKASRADTLDVTWPDGRYQRLQNISANQVLTLNYKEAVSAQPVPLRSPDFQDVTAARGIDFVHQEDLYDDFRAEPLLPHKNSQQGPGLAVGDVNGDGRDDFFVGGAARYEGSMYHQTPQGTFQKVAGPWQEDRDQEDTGALLFDADNDQDLDLYVVSGGNTAGVASSYYQDRLYLNTSSGFVKATGVLPPEVAISGKVVAADDYDNDGDLDLFLGGRLLPGQYPYPASSVILRNEGGTDQQLRYQNVTTTVAPLLDSLGLVTDAQWTDFDQDGLTDLVVVGEWMKILFLKNEGDTFQDVSSAMGLDATRGWWYSILATDMDQDGDQDYLVGNLGLNYKYKTSEENPFTIYAHDFDENGRRDIVLSYEKGGKQLPVRGRECSSQQMPVIQERFSTYEAFADATLEDIYGEHNLKDALQYQIDTFASGWLEKTDGGQFQWHSLPNQAQFSSINAVVLLSTDGDSHPTFIAGGNLYSSEVETPRADAGYGVVLQHLGDSVAARLPTQTGLYVRGEVKDIVEIELADHQRAYLFAINNDSLRMLIPVSKAPMQ